MATNRATRYPGRWGAVSADYPMGVPKNRTSDTAKDGSYFEKDWIADYEAFFGAILTDAGESPNGVVDTAQNSQIYNAHIAKVEEIATEKLLERVIEVSPLNNDWNGYLDPDHQSSLPSGAGYPGNSGGGEVAYAADEEISYGIYAGASGATVSSDSDGWIFTGSIYKLYDYTAAQLDDIDETTAPVYLKDQAGIEYFVNDSTTGVNVTKVGGQLKVEITDAIFTVSLTKLWRFFPTEKVGYIGEMGVDESINAILSNSDFRDYVDETLNKSTGVEYTNTNPYPILVKVFTGLSTSPIGTITVDGEIADAIDINATNSRISMSAPIKSGSVYEVNISNALVQSWREYK